MPCLDARRKKKIFSTCENQFDFFTDAINTLLSNPAYKLLEILTVPILPEKTKEFSTDTWEGLEKRLFQMSISNSNGAKINWQIRPSSKFSNKTLGNILISRGPDDEKSFGGPHKFRKFCEKEMYTERFTARFQQFRSGDKFNNNPKSMSLLRNSAGFLDSFEVISGKANSMFSNKAYLYQYEKYGLEYADFVESLADFEKIISSY